MVKALSIDDSLPQRKRRTKEPIPRFRLPATTNVASHMIGVPQRMCWTFTPRRYTG